MTEFDIVVIGAGPAGMAAALEADRAGASVLVLDEQQQPGGQIYRGVSDAADLQSSILGSDYTSGRELTEQFLSSACIYVPAATVWKVTETAEVVYSNGQRASQVSAKRVIIANGALERPMPVPGWTLPGVMTAGAAQILLKSNSVVVQDAVLAGCGPLLYLLAVQLIRAGHPPRAIVETQTPAQLRSALRSLPAAIKGWRTLAKGLSLLTTIRRARVPRYRGVSNIHLTGVEKVGGIEFVHAGQSQRIDCDAVLLHQGVIPNTQISRSLNLEHHWHPVQRCFTPTVDAWGVSSNSRISLAGDGAEINGAIGARLLGQRAALGCLASLNLITVISRDRQAKQIDQQLKNELAPRPFIDTLYAPADNCVLPADETIVCRCENVTAGDIRRYATLGCVGPNQTKAFGRSGMGRCQGRYCGVTITEILAASNDQLPAETGSYRIRSPIKPVSLAELASLHNPQRDTGAPSD